MRIKNDLILRTLRKENVERPPVWAMRQAGRILPHYRSIRAKAGSFKKLVTNPEWIAEASIEPVEVLDVDAAIIFSDILVIPEAMGLDYEIIEKKGPLFKDRIRTIDQIEKLAQGRDIPERLSYVFESIKLTKKALEDRVPLIGFAGAPWTIFAYMVEGSGSKTFSNAKKMIYKEPEMSHQLLEKITTSTIHYLKEKIKSGVNIIQLFDSWSGLLDSHIYNHFAWPYAQKILGSIKETPTIFFPKGGWFSFDTFGDSRDFDCLGIDWSTHPDYAREKMGDDITLQGNMDPCQLYASSVDIRKATIKMLSIFGRNHIANLGHGVYPDTKIENIKCFIDTVKEFDYEPLN